ncbi:MAG: prepilin-type N-terminal cleavage/methylation domain-containing protein [Candidatus Pacebacteria bacterium]|nr:prepilin-type N-terminal cleavage/methylation domain-containing protein [Candidatus Paceibacterota bacterium]
MRKNNGFTLIETIVYIALLSLLLGGVLTVSYDLIESSSKQSQSIAVDEELNFLSRKIDWILIGVSNINTPSTSLASSTLSVRKYNSSQNPLTLHLQDGLLVFSRGNMKPVPLNDELVKIDSISFSYIPPVMSGSPAGVLVVLQIGNRFITTTYYVR